MAQNRGTLSYVDYVKGIDHLKPEEQLNLVGLLSSRLKKTVNQRAGSNSILELEGLGAEEWQGINAQDYVREERESWG